MNARSTANHADVTPSLAVFGGASREGVPIEMNVPNDGRLVLLVSDDPLMSRALSRLLRKAGYDVVIGEENCDEAGTDGQRCPALVIVDIPDDRIPRTTAAGFRLRGRPDAPSVLWIGDSNETERWRDDHLAKPFTGNQLLSKVASLLSS